MKCYTCQYDRCLVGFIVISPIYLNNQLIVATPNLGDIHFHRTVAFICEHNENGAVGIIINRPLNIRLDHLFSQMKIKPVNESLKLQPILYGGPIQQERGFVIHRPAGQWRSSLILTDDIAVTTSQDLVESIAQDEGPSDVLVALGYAGWGPQQLEAELAANAWLSCPAKPDILFNTPFANRWKMAASEIGFDMEHFSTEIGHA